MARVAALAGAAANVLASPSVGYARGALRQAL